MMGIGQRYDVIINANQTAGNYWFRAEKSTGCFSNVVAGAVGRSIFTYDDKPVADPPSTATANSGFPTVCADPQTTPFIARNVPKDTFRVEAQHLPVAFDNKTTIATNNQSVVLWTVNGTTMWIDPSEPTLEYISKGKTEFPKQYNLIHINPEAAWTYWVIQQAVGAPPLPHPIHLHGHDMFVLGTGSGQFDVNTHLDSLKFTNPVRRDVAHLPGNGWLVIAYPSDNPGAWLMHCHIAFHVAMGLSVQFLEREKDITMPGKDSE